MGLFKKKTDYSYYSSYSSSRRRLKVGRTVIAVIAAVVVILGIIIYFNFNRIQFLMKGYSWSTTSELVSSFDNDEEKVKALDKIVAEKMGFESSYGVTGQTYPRKLDSIVLNRLSEVAQSAYKFSNDLRLLQNMLL